MIQTSKSCHFSASVPAVWLVDNGSLRAESVLALRGQAARLTKAARAQTGNPVLVEAVSVLHSSKIAAEQLGGVPARTFTSYLRTCAANGLRKLLVLPYFFGPSAALTDYLPEQIARVRQDFPQLQVQIAPPLVDLAAAQDGAAEALAAALEQAVTAVLETVTAADAGAVSQPATDKAVAEQPAVVLVDHGSPQPAVSAVRDSVGAALRGRLAGRARAFGVCSMEAREGEGYAHTLPLLAQVLSEPLFRSGRVIVAPLFLSPGRHAGEGGDLWQIAEAVRAEHPSLRVTFTALPGQSEAVTGILLKRLRDGLERF